MDFYTIIIIVALVLLIISLTLFGVYYRTFSVKPFPETQDFCPKLWTVDSSGNCIKPSTDISYNKLNSIPIDTPGKLSNGFNPNDSGWGLYSGATNSICGKKKWSDKNNITWNGVSNYNSC